ncbi:MAG: hypothetical protein MUD12_14135 [Spirochaetes bacterium]|jgi:hypothetical protein|nr:hypothetical protein [Spirochaetota bacterium]
MNVKKFLYLILAISAAASAFGEDYEYQYFKNKGKKYTPFSDYIPKVRLHYKTVPHYLEDYYELYGMKQYYNENSLRKNIERLKTALECKFRHPSEAIVRIDTEEEYLKYRKLMFMHINMLIMRNHLSIASRYDKQKIYFYNAEFAKEINESLDIAEKYYSEAVPYWEKAKKYAEEASAIKITTALGFIESERYSIIHNEYDFAKIIDNYLRKVKEKKKKLSEMTASRGV